jgi:transcriptional regulator with XRE-family HTH domain
MPLKVKPSTLGERIRRLRKNQKVSLQYLANETGHSVEYIEKIENGDVTPPVAVLLKLSRALQVDSGEFLKKDSEAAEKRAQAQRMRTEHYSYQVLTPESAQKRLKGFLVTIEPASDLKGVSYQHEGEEFIYVLKGQVTVAVGENVNHLGQGESLHFNSALVHKLTNEGDTECELLVMLYTP